MVTKEPQTIAEMWAMYWGKIKPAHPVKNQEAETKTAFYAGVISMFGLMTQICEAEEDIAAAALEKLDQEATEWMKRDIGRRYKSESPNAGNV